MEQRLSTLPSEMCYYLYLQGLDDTVTHEVQSITTPEDGASQRLRSESPSCHLNCKPSSLLHYLSCFPKAPQNLQRQGKCKLSRKNLSPEGNCGISHKMQYVARFLHWFRQECHLNTVTVHKQRWKLIFFFKIYKQRQMLMHAKLKVLFLFGFYSSCVFCIYFKVNGNIIR